MGPPEDTLKTYSYAEIYYSHASVRTRLLTPFPPDRKPRHKHPPRGDQSQARPTKPSPSPTSQSSPASHTATLHFLAPVTQPRPYPAHNSSSRPSRPPQHQTIPKNSCAKQKYTSTDTLTPGTETATPAAARVSVPDVSAPVLADCLPGLTKLDVRQVSP